MSEKKPAARDISDLKARLGLKKKGPAKAAGGIAAPPGMMGRAGIPAPPGAAPPQPHIPDASKDPFGAMNAMAAHQAQARAPEFIVVNDGTPVESVERKAAGARYAKIAGIILGPLIVGVAVGQIGSSAKRSNEVIEDAGKIRDDLKKLNTGLVSLNDVLLEARTRGPGGKGYAMSDKKLTADLEAFDFPPIDGAVVYQSSMYELPVEVVENLLYYYQETKQLKDMIKEHVQKAKKDEKAIDDAGKRLSENVRFGATIVMPTDDEKNAGMPPKIHIVELGAPLCSDGSVGRCANGPPKGFSVREDAKGLTWMNKSFAQSTENSVGSDGLMLVEPTPVFSDAIAGADASLAMVFYMKRIAEIDAKVTELTEIGQKLASQLNSKANESTKFTFFL